MALVQCYNIAGAHYQRSSPDQLAEVLYPPLSWQPPSLAITETHQSLAVPIPAILSSPPVCPTSYPLHHTSFYQMLLLFLRALLPSKGCRCVTHILHSAALVLISCFPEKGAAVDTMPYFRCSHKVLFVSTAALKCFLETHCHDTNGKAKVVLHVSFVSYHLQD